MTERDLWDERLKGAVKIHDGKAFVDELVVHKLTVLNKKDQEGLTLIPEDDETYAHLRWVTRTGWFMFSWVAHQFKRIKGVRYADFHTSGYIGTGEDPKDKRGAIDIEFGEDAKDRTPMMSIQDLNMRMVGDSGIAIQDKVTKKRYWIEVVNGEVKAVPVKTGELHDDSVKV